MPEFIKPCEADAPLTGWWNSYPGHKALDYGFRNPDPVRTKRIYAAYKGVVVSVYSQGGNNLDWGNRIVIEHAPGIRTTYNHMRTGTLTVRVGQTVETGAYLGQMGSTGKVTGDHLHWELYIDGFRVDPQPYREGRPIPRVPEPSVLQPNQRKVLSSDLVKRRVGSPYTSSPEGESLAAGVVGTFSSWTRGQSVNGNDIWFRGFYDEEGYFWSGGFEGGANTAGLPEVQFHKPTTSNQRVVGSLSVNGRVGPGTQYETKAGEDGLISLAPATLGNFVGWDEGEKVTIGGVESNIWIQGTSGRWFAIAGFTNITTDGIPRVTFAGPIVPPKDTTPVTPTPEVPLNNDYKTFSPDSTLAEWAGSPNFDFGPRRPVGTPAVGITLHWFGANAQGVTASLADTATYFGSLQGKPTKNGRGTGTSSTYGVGSDGKRLQFVKEAAYHHCDGDAYSNGHRIAIEHEAGPNKQPTDQLYKASIELVADVARRNNLGKLELGKNVVGHRDVVPTQCPGTLDLQRIIDGANLINFPPTPKPEPEPEPQPEPEPEKVLVDKAALLPLWNFLKGIFGNK